MTRVTCRLTAKNRDQLRNPTLGNRVWATFTFLEAAAMRPFAISSAAACRAVVDLVGAGAAGAHDPDGAARRRRQLHGEGEQRRRSGQVLRDSDCQAGVGHARRQDATDRVVPLGPDASRRRRSAARDHALLPRPVCPSR